MVVYLIEYTIVGEGEASLLCIHKSFSSAMSRASVLMNEQLIELEVDDNYGSEVQLDDENEEATFYLKNPDGVVIEAWHVRGVVVED